MQKNKNSKKNILIFIRVIFFVLLLSGIVYKIQMEVQIVKIEILCFKYHMSFLNNNASRWQSSFEF